MAALNSLAATSTTTTTNSSSSPEPPNSLTSSATNSTNNTAAVNPYFKLEDLHQAAAQAAAQVAQQRPNQSLYWPGIQGLISNPNLWRDRFSGKKGISVICVSYC